MKWLAIDTSTDVASIALKVDEEIMSESLPSQKVQAQKILPMIDGLLSHAQLHLNQLDGIILGRGPGSFTGLRIACSVVKGLAYAYDLPVYPVSTLAAIAEEARSFPTQQDKPILAVLDARMKELYWGYFSSHALTAEEKVSTASDIMLPDNQDWQLAGLGFELYDDFSSYAGLKLHPKAEFMIKLVEKGAVTAMHAADVQPIYIRNTVTQG